MKVLSFSEARMLLADPMSPMQMLEKIKRDFMNLPKDAVDSISEWAEMYERYSSGNGIADTITNGFWDMLADIGSDIWNFLYDCSYWIALFVGLGAMLLYACGHRGALKWTWTAILGYTIICAFGSVFS